MPLHGLFTGDEEIGSPASRPVIEAAARGAVAVFNSEPGRVSGNIVDGRRFGTFFCGMIEGRAGHAGLHPADGRDATHELAHKIVAWCNLNDEDRDVSVNVGLVLAGRLVNTVAPDAVAEIDLCFTRLEDGERVGKRIAEIVRACARDGLSAEIATLGAFLPKVHYGNARALRDGRLAAAEEPGQKTGAETCPKVASCCTATGPQRPPPAGRASPCRSEGKSASAARGLPGTPPRSSASFPQNRRPHSPTGYPLTRAHRLASPPSPRGYACGAAAA